MSDLARRLLDLTVEYAARVEAETWDAGRQDQSRPPAGRGLAEIAADYDAALRSYLTAPEGR